MRELKFRAWDLSKKKILYDEEISGYLCYFFVGYTDCSGCAKEKDCELMQYTGLKDKNGKEIYEGDIVTWQSRNEKCISEVYYSRGQFCVDPEHKKDWYQLEAYLDQDMEIVGNIYENPKLLEGI